MDEKRMKLLAKEPVGKAIIVMAIPMILGMMIQLLYNMVDIYFIGMLKDQAQLAAANLATPLFMLMMAISGVIGTGASSYISRCMGKSDFSYANKVLSSGIAMCFFIGLAATFLGSILINPIVTILGASSETFSYTKEYSQILIGGAAIIMCNFALGQLLRSEGSTVVSMMGMLIGTLVNIILNPILVFVLGMGVQGSALATVLGNGSGLLYYVLFYVRKKSILRFTVKDISLDKTIWKEIFTVGIPSSISQVLMGVAVVMCNHLAGFYGDATLAGMGIASKIMTIGTYIFMGFSVGCQPLIGYNYGAKNENRVREIIKKGMLYTSGVGILITIIFALFSKPLVGFFTPLENVVSEGSMILLGLMWSLPIYGAQMVGAVAIQAMGKAKESLVLSVARQGVFYLPILFIMNGMFGIKGLIGAQPIADLLALVLTCLLLVKVKG